ncbi:MAG: hypothetical protein LBQ60_11820 [Bacteroidales bacterium]|nr:hypothetical protein [Bacteroidales bacterium]
MNCSSRPSGVNPWKKRTICYGVTKGANTILTPVAPLLSVNPSGFGDTKEGDLPATGITRGNYSQCS